MTRKHHDRTRVRALCRLAIIGGVVALLAACGQDEGTQNNNNPSSSTSQDGTSASAENSGKPTWAAITDQTWPPGGLKRDQSLARNPMQSNIMVILDMSGSMASRQCAGQFNSKAAAAREALKHWVSSIPRDVNLGLVTFSSRGTERPVPLGMDNRKEFIIQALSVPPGGNTPLKSAMKLAVRDLTAQARAQLGYGRYQIVTITDGEYSPGENPLPVIDKILDNAANPIGIDTIGFCLNDSVLRQPGRIQYRSANDPQQLAQGLSSVLAESESFKPLENFDEN